MLKISLVALVGLCAILSMCSSFGSAQSDKSISLGGYTFTSDLGDGWIVPDDVAVYQKTDAYYPDDSDTAWKGYYVWPWLKFPSYPNAPKDDEEYQSSRTFAIIYVLTIPPELKAAQLKQNIRVYGSIDKVPEDQKEKDTNEILAIATGKYTMDMTSNSEKDITFNDRQAHLIEADNSAYSGGRIAIALDNDTIGLIDVTVYYTQNNPFDGRAWDVINSIKIT